MTVVDIGAGENPDPRADLTVDRRAVADRQADLNDEWPLETAGCERVIARHVVEHLDDIDHAFQEAARVLEFGGRFEVTVPLGTDAAMDDAHERQWTWRSPEQYSRAHRRGWDPDVPFRLERRQLEGGFLPPFNCLHRLVQPLAERYPRAVAWRLGWGELTAVFVRTLGDRK